MHKTAKLVAARRYGTALLGAVALAVAAMFSPACAHAEGDRRVALVIGNGAYQHVGALANPANDALLMASVLRTLGFEIVGGGAQLNLDRAHLQTTIAKFQLSAARSTIALFYYSGHGLQVDGANYLVPVDANLATLPDVDTQLVDAGTALRVMQQPSTALKIFVMDACRNNPFSGRGLRAPGLAEMRAQRGTIISYATQPGGVAADGAGHDSPYTAALAQALRVPGLEVVHAFNQVALQVSQATDSEQEPWLALASIPGDFYLAGRQGSGAEATLSSEPAASETTMRAVPALPATTATAWPAPVFATTDAPSELGRRYFGRNH